MNKGELLNLWEDERHWGDGPLGGYFCKEDPRLVVPKRRRLGGTFNLAHRFAIPILTAIILLLAVLVVMGWLVAGIILFDQRGPKPGNNGMQRTSIPASLSSSKAVRAAVPGVGCFFS